MRKGTGLAFCFAAAIATPAAVVAGRGGPDAGGWVWLDSNEPGVDTFVKTRLSSTTFASPMADDEVYPVNLSFPFTLYGTTTSTVWVSSNGWISLVDPRGDPAPANRALPSTASPNALIAYYWDDLGVDPSNGGVEGPIPGGHQIHMRHSRKGSGATVDVDIEFYTNGALKIIYKYAPRADTLTAGIENAAGTTGTQLLHDGAYTPGFTLGNGYAVLFHPRSTPPCASATGLACPGNAAATTAGGASLAIAYGCGGGEFRGRERVHELRLAGAQDLSLSLTGNAGRDQAIFLLHRGCDGYLDCIAGGSTSINVPLIGAGTYMVVVDGRSTADDGDYTLSASCAAESTPIACGQTVVDQATGASRIDDYTCTGRPFSGPEVIYDFSLPAPRTVTATLTPDIPWGDILLVKAETLAPVTSSCIENGDVVGELNLPAGNYSLVVDTVPFPGGDFTLDLQCQARVDATAIACGDVDLPGVNTGPGLTELYPCRPGTFSLGEAYFRFRPAGRVIATAMTADAANFDVFAFREPQAPRQCLASGDSSVTLVNLLPQDILFVLDSDTVSGSAPLTLRCTDMSPPALTCGQTASGVTASTGVARGYSCIPQNMEGGETFFLYNNPVVQDLAFAVWGAPASADLRAAILQGTFDGAGSDCLAGGAVARLRAAPPGEYLIVVDGAPRTGDVPFELTTICGDLPVDCAAAADLTCNAVVAGDTAGGTRAAFVYDGLDALYPGPERVYRFSNPVTQPVNFLLRNPSDERLDLVLLSGCDGAALVDFGDRFIARPDLPPGEYFLVVDGREGASGSFELVTFCGGPYLDPPRLDGAVESGRCLGETKRLFYPIHAPAADVMFSIDLSESMGGEIAETRANICSIYSGLKRLVPSLRFGIATFVEYDRPYTDTVCSVDHAPLAANPFPYRLDLPLTGDIAAVETTLAGIDVIGGGKETYTYTFEQARVDPAIGWRSCVRRLWLNIGDEIPIDCDALGCIGMTRNEGRDPGPDLITGTADDIELLPVVDAMGNDGIQMIAVDSSETPELVALWDCLARRTGGHVFATNRFGRMRDGSAVAPALLDSIREVLRVCPDLRLEATGPYASWVTITPSSLADVDTPFYGEFQVDFCVPPGTPAGVYPVPVEARCLRPGSCAAEVLGRQDVEITASTACGPGPVARAAAAALCEGGSAVLDASGSSACGPAGLLHRWLEGTTVVCDWSASPTCAVSPAATTDYTLEVACADQPGCVDVTTVPVAVEPRPLSALAPVGPLCGPGSVVLDAAATDPRGCSTGLEYRFLEGATLLRDWATSPTHGPVAGTASTRFTAEARCPAAADCAAAAAADLVVVPPPVAAAGPDLNVCQEELATLDGSGSSEACPGGVLYEWWEGATLLRPASADPTCVASTSAFGTRTYRLVVACADLPTCAAGDEVSVTVRNCSLAVTFERFGAVWRGPGAARVTWRTLGEDGTLAFDVERAGAPAGPFTRVARVGAVGPGHDYEVSDDAVPPGPAPWYRIVERTEHGAGDASPPFTVEEAAPVGSRSGLRERAGARRR